MTPPSTLFVTGGSGFVGGAVIGGLSGSHRVLAMARSDEAAAAVSARGASAVHCDLGSVTPDHLDGADAVVHCAARVADWGPDRWFRHANVDGTATLVDAARLAGVNRFVHVSTESVLFSGDHLDNVDEHTPYPERTPYPYSSSKAAAERIVLGANDPSAGFATVIVRPVLVWGRGDRTVLPEVVELARHGRWVWLDGGRHRVTPTHIDNLVHGISLALDRGRPGEVYFLTDGTHLPFREFLASYAATAGVELGDRSVPGWLGRSVARAVEWTWRRLAPERKPPLTAFAAASTSRHIVVDDAKARRELGYHPVTTLEEGLAALRSAHPA